MNLRDRAIVAAILVGVSLLCVVKIFVKAGNGHEGDLRIATWIAGIAPGWWIAAGVAVIAFVIFGGRRS